MAWPRQVRSGDAVGLTGYAQGVGPAPAPLLVEAEVGSYFNGIMALKLLATDTVCRGAAGTAWRGC